MKIKSVTLLTAIISFLAFVPFMYQYLLNSKTNNLDNKLKTVSKQSNSKNTQNKENPFKYTEPSDAYNIPFVNIVYIPEKQKGTVDTTITGNLPETKTQALLEKINTLTTTSITTLTKATKYKGYKNSKSTPSLQYTLHNTIKEYISMPIGKEVPWKKSQHVYRPDYVKILSNINICDLVDNKGIKEVWLWGYHTDIIEPAESNMSMGRKVKEEWNKGVYGDISNSEESNDMPICENTYVLYNLNYGRDLGELLENRTHHIEEVMKFVDTLFWQSNFVGNCNTDNKIARCGWTHYPPNVMDFCNGHDYDWYNPRLIMSDCENWTPNKTGQPLEVSCKTWGGETCPEDGGSAFKVWWMQNIPGKNNNLSYNGKKLKNFWSFIGDFDTNIQDKTFFYD